MCSCYCFEAQARSRHDPTYPTRNMFHNVYAVLHAVVVVVVVDAGGGGGTEANAAHF